MNFYSIQIKRIIWISDSKIMQPCIILSKLLIKITCLDDKDYKFGFNCQDKKLQFFPISRDSSQGVKYTQVKKNFIINSGISTIAQKIIYEHLIYFPYHFSFF
ncbi:hypothetical protein pb186bvf_005302 [Paramecium bursaria]